MKLLELDYIQNNNELYKSLADRCDKYSENEDGTSLTLNDLYDELKPEEKYAVKMLLSIDPMNYGQKLKIINTIETSVRLNKILNQEYISVDDNSKYFMPPRFLPQKPYTEFMNMNMEMNKAIRRKLIINTGYRGHGFQILLFCRMLVYVYDYDLASTLSRVLLPKFSQHCSPTNTAIDFRSYDDKTTEENLWAFASSAEYDWLSKHASEFGYSESYPKNNKIGMTWEPWHWQYTNGK